jgi:hypothetical protein
VEAPDEPPVRVVLERGAHESQGVGLVFPCRQFPGLSLVAAVPSERGEEGGGKTGKEKGGVGTHVATAMFSSS